MYSAFCGAHIAPGQDELRAYLSLLAGRVVANQFGQQVSRHAVVTVLSSLLFLCRPRWGNSSRRRSAEKWERVSASKPRASLCAVHVRQFEGASPLSNLMEVKDKRSA